MVKICMHNGQVEFDGDTDDVLCAICKKPLVWVQSVQLRSLAGNLRQGRALIEAMDQYILRLRQVAYAGLEVQRRAMREIEEMDLAGKVESARRGAATLSK